MKRALIYSFFPLLSAGIFTAGVASAHGLGSGLNGTPTEITARFQREAALLGVPVDEVKTAWAAGKNLFDVATAHGITKEQLAQKLKDERTAEVKAQLQVLVTQGVITQAQADQRLAFIQAKQAKAKTKPVTDGEGKKGRGFGRGGRFGGL